MKKIALALGGILLALILAEVVLRVSGVGEVRPRLHFDVHTTALVEAGRFATHPQLFWRQMAGPNRAQERQWRIVHVGDHPPSRTSRYRILCLGDSCSRLAERGPPYPVLLEQELGPREVEVFTAALPGYTSHQGLAWLELELLDYRPDLVVVYFGWNDHWRSTGMTDRRYAQYLAPHRPRLLKLWARAQRPPPLRVGLEEYEENLRRIADLVAGRGGRTLLLTAPYNFTAENEARFRANGNIIAGDRPEELHARYLDVVRGLAGEPGIDVLDLAAIFREVDEPRLLLMRDGIHPTDLGHAALAGVLGQVIGERYLDRPEVGESPVEVVRAVVERHLVGPGE